MEARYDSVWQSVFPYVQDPWDRDALSLVCKRWYKIDADTRKHVTVDICYRITPQHLFTRFPNLVSLKVKGRGHGPIFRKDCWGGTVTKWVEKIIESCKGMKSLHLTRMTVNDRDLKMLANSSVGQALEVLKLDECDGFSTTGVLLVARLCRNLKFLVMEGSDIIEENGKWLHELAINNTVLESLNFFRTCLGEVETGDLELIARNCSSLSSMKICYSRLLDLIGFFQAATSLEEFAGYIYRAPRTQDVEEGAGLIELPESYDAVAFPPNLCRLGLLNLCNGDLLTIYPVAPRLEMLDLSDSKLLDIDGQCLLLQRCPDLEILTAVIGDRGLEIIAGSCKKMKRLKIVKRRRSDGVEGWVSDRGIIAVAEGCLELEHLDVWVDVITNAALERIGEHLKKLRVFRLSYLDHKQCGSGSDFLPLDEGVGSLLKGCQKLRRLALHLRPGCLTDVGLGYIGQYSPNVRYMSLSSIGLLSVYGLNEFSKGCRRLHKLELVNCLFKLPQLSTTVLQMKCLRYLWVLGFPVSSYHIEVSGMVRPDWNFEFLVPTFSCVDYCLGGILAYHSHAGRRTDFPRTQFVVPLNPHPPLLVNGDSSSASVAD